MLLLLMMMLKWTDADFCVPVIKHAFFCSKIKKDMVQSLKNLFLSKHSFVTLFSYTSAKGVSVFSKPNVGLDCLQHTFIDN